MRAAQRPTDLDGARRAARRLARQLLRACEAAKPDPESLFDASSDMIRAAAHVAAFAYGALVAQREVRS